LQSVQQLEDAPTQDRVNGVRRDLGERLQNEAALVHPRMRDRERGTSKTPPPEEKQIEIERARSVALAAALASVMALDRAEAREKRAW